MAVGLMGTTITPPWPKKKVWLETFLKPHTGETMITAREIGPQRYRTSYGRYFEDFQVGDVYEHRPGRTLTDQDNISFALLTMNQHPMHCDMEFAKKSEFGRLLINSPLSLAVVVGMTVNDVSAKAIANLGWKDIKLSGPVFAGDTLYAETKVLDKRESKSRPHQGIVTVHTRGINQDGVEIMSFERIILVACRGHAVDD
jgi:acyl dehydratase